jgi:hypothetical protein
LELEDGQITQSFIPIPKTRSLYQVKGSLVEVEQKLSSLRCKYQLPVLLDIAIEETTYKPAVMEAIAAWRETLPARNIRLIQQRVTYLDRINNSRKSALQAERVHDLQPEVVFSSLIKEREDDAEKTAIMELFQSILSDLTR